MAEETSRPDDSTGLVVGLIFLLAVGYGIYRLGSFIVSRWETPPPIVALSAYFADEAGNPMLDEKVPNAHLKIKGQVQRRDNQAADGKVRITVENLDQTFSQTLIVEAKGGNFETEDPSLRTLRQSDQIHIKAEFLSPESAQEPPGEIYLNTRPPKVTSDTLWAIGVVVLIVVFIVFFYSFTGKKTPLKNRIAVIFSYCVIGIFMFLPLMAPVLLVPSDRRAMMDRPVALVLTKVGPADDKEKKVQWALNIGGYATSPSLAQTPTPQSATAPKASATASPTASATASPTASATASPTASATASPTASATASPVGIPTTSPSPVPTTRGQRASASPPPGAPSQTPTPAPQIAVASNDDLVVNVEGGLVIPLYVIILSVIGGAINMTRKVPQLQEEGERSEIVAVGGIKAKWKATWNRVRHPFGGKTKSSPELPPAEGGPSPQTSEPANATGNQTSPPGSPPSTPAAKPTPAAGATAADDTIAAEIDAKVGELVDAYAKSDSDAQNAKKNIRDLVNKMKELFDKRSDKKPILDYDSFDDWLDNRPALKELFTTHWRVELLSQYMYLVSAPFLAIVAYYMLDLAGLTKPQIFVLISFSVGLVSERILSWLLGIASGYLRESPSQPASK